MPPITPETSLNSTKNGNGDRFRNVSAEKLRGGYYTSPEISEWLCRWAIRKNDDHILEPSCGDGSFLIAAVERYFQLTRDPQHVPSVNLTGVEVVEEEAEQARRRLQQRFGLPAKRLVVTNDFFAWCNANERRYDAVIGNPPFIRYQSFPEPYRSRGMGIMESLGLKPNRLTNAWVPFVVASAASLRPGGRLALVLPAELLQVTYAAQLRSFLTDRFSRIDIVASNELLFAKAEQEVVLLLADGYRSTPSSDAECRVAMSEIESVSDLASRSPNSILDKVEPKSVQHDSEKWLKYFLTPREISLMRSLRDTPEVTNLATHANVDVGVVTGRNAFFVLNAGDVDRLSLEEYVVPLVSRSVQLRGATIDAADWRSLAEAGDRVHLLHLAGIDGDPLNESLQRYIAAGEDQGIHEGYKCSIRTPWYAVPSVWEPDGFMFRQIYDFPRIVLNQAKATSTDTIHRVRCTSDPRLVIPNTYTYMTAASAEIEGRSYGGGVLELEPTEAERLLMPNILAESLPPEECDRLIRKGRLDELLKENSRLILNESVGLSIRDCTTLQHIWEKMRDRRRRRTSSKVKR